VVQVLHVASLGAPYLTARTLNRLLTA
jgi:hypothetical protein